MLVFIVPQFRQYTDEILTSTKSKVVKSYNLAKSYICYKLMNCYYLIHIFCSFNSFHKSLKQELFNFTSHLMSPHHDYCTP